jgi:hypothetical protein
MKSTIMMSIALCASNYMTAIVAIRPLSGFIPSSQHCRFSKVTYAASKFNPHEPTIPIVDSMPSRLPPLNNYYYLVRHGQSTANVEGIISSARSLAGSTKHGLTLLGEEQGRDSAKSLIGLIEEDVKHGELSSTKTVYFYSSPFARAKETAYACLKGIGEDKVAARVKELGLDVRDDVSIEDRLMERYVA